ncbi:hypothetical protein [Winogradskyella alexanderae]|uniref:Uncharacterized protein n=1 Tax=Winogradskyella alexanderae TaxID=2877123 RepID=A0ABS7XUL9_9FLAO|nr:hypothetical protein [Winogradskyella alexanderae]MCA0133184.1 hypothetical protein [Winogradskyella alexanderae]
MPTQLVIIHIIELIAAIAGSIYYLKTKDKILKPFVWYLWFVVFVETVGMYGYIMQWNFDNELFIKLKNSAFCENRWLYNTFAFVSLLFYWFFYNSIISDKKSKGLLDVLGILYVVFTLGFFIVTDGFFVKQIPYDAFLETLFIFVAVILYYRQLLIGENVLYFYREPLFYVSTSLLLWHLIITPLVIFDGYFNLINKRFIGFRMNYLLFTNIILYSCYTFGFLYTLQFRKQFRMKK